MQIKNMLHCPKVQSLIVKKEYEEDGRNLSENVEA